jgi:hypothetical protein
VEEERKESEAAVCGLVVWRGSSSFWTGRLDPAQDENTDMITVES